MHDPSRPAASSAPRRLARRRRHLALAGLAVGVLSALVACGEDAPTALSSTPGYEEAQSTIDTRPFESAAAEGEGSTTLPRSLLDGGVDGRATTTPPTTTTTLPPLSEAAEADPLCEVVRRSAQAVQRIVEGPASSDEARASVLESLRPIPDLLGQAGDARLDDLRAGWADALARAEAAPNLDGVVAAVRPMIESRPASGGTQVFTDHVATACPTLGSYLDPSAT